MAGYWNREPQIILGNLVYHIPPNIDVTDILVTDFISAHTNDLTTKYWRRAFLRNEPVPARFYHPAGGPNTPPLQAQKRAQK
jgi:hypothetical protein